MEAFLCFAGGSANCILLWRQTKYSKNSFTFVGSFSWHGNSQLFLYYFFTFFSHSSAAFSLFAEFIFKFEIVCQNNKNVFRLSCVCSFHHSAVVKYFSVAFCFLSLPVAAGQKQECGQKIFFSDLH